tara:strand:- start:748 stop:1677 length:930 start_codon:yes stop_codon:yes gene_type:complete
MNFSKPNFWDKNKISFLSILLFPASLLVRFIGFINKFITKKYKYSIPVICVGNIYLGGTGKTPMCIEIFSILEKLNMNPVFIRKKYNSFQDEIDLQKQVGLVYEGKKRTDALKSAIQNKANVAILDDGFQDFSIEKNLSIVCFNEKQKIGNGFIIPSGPLRESLSALKRADCVVINGKKNSDFENKIFKENKEIKIFYTKYSPKNIENFKNKNIVAFAGIGNPENFFDLLEDNKVNIVKKVKYPDHYKYSKEDLEKLIEDAKVSNSILITTEKDYFRIEEKYKKNINFLKINVEIENRNQFIEEIKKII